MEFGPTHHDGSLHGWDAHRARWQAVLNEREIPRRGLQRDCRVLVTARIVWEIDGEEYRDTLAYAWAPRRLVLVEVLDDRRLTHGVWLHVSDVRRRD
ncbi:hypothetical protein ACFQHV_00900 [Promicromonospora thailandica]|nr:hypothetical protein [Promicromonospora thailandica]